MAPLPEVQIGTRRIPFPVLPHYPIRPDLRKLEPGAKRFVRDDRWREYLERKLELLNRDPERCRVIAGEEDAVRRGLLRVARLLSREHPELCRIERGGLAFPSIGLLLPHEDEPAEHGEAGDCELRRRLLLHLAPLPPTARLADALALTVQEDLVLIGGPPGADSAALLHVCFPSHWDPGERAGASFAQLHQPVPHNERLLAGARNMIAAMLSKGPFIRFVWSITRTPHLDQNPARPHPPERHGGNLLDGLFFRSERQTTTPLGALSLFTIRIYVAPLSRVLDADRAALLARAIRSMDDEVLSYKSLSGSKEQLLFELDALADGAISRARPRGSP